MNWTDNLPGWMKAPFASAAEAEEAIATEGDAARLKSLRERADRASRTLDLFASASELVESMEHELKAIQDAMVMTREVNDLLRLQGQAVALYKIVNTPKQAALELRVIEGELKPLEQSMAARDAADTGE